MTASSDDRARLDALHSDLMARWPESRIDPSLDRIGRLTELLGDPQRSYPVIHVTGTNGKSSTARMIESLLRAFGLRTGLYTSPHLASVTERILLDGEPVDDARFLEAYDDIAPYVEVVDAESVTTGGPAMSYFEVLTGMAFAIFADAPVDVAVVEVGMGGLWDATNVADGTVAVVMPVAIDHADYLGGTIAAIAGEKAGIIKPGSIAVLSAQAPEAAAILLARCEEVGAATLKEGVDFAVVGREVAVGGQVLTLQVEGGGIGDGVGTIDPEERERRARGTETVVYPDLLLPLHGSHQAQNAAAALAAVSAFLTDGSRTLDTDLVREGFGAVRSPGRLEVLRRSPTVIVDAAHNPHGARALAEALDEAFSFTRLVGVLAVLADKDARAILESLEPILDEVVVTSSRSPRALPVDELAELARAVMGDDRVHAARGISDAVALAVELADEQGSGAGVVVTGSVVTVAEARALWARPEAPDPGAAETVSSADPDGDL